MKMQLIHAKADLRFSVCKITNIFPSRKCFCEIFSFPRGKSYLLLRGLSFQPRWGEKGWFQRGSLPSPPLDTVKSSTWHCRVLHLTGSSPPLDKCSTSGGHLTIDGGLPNMIPMGLIVIAHCEPNGQIHRRGGSNRSSWVCSHQRTVGTCQHCSG